MQLNCLFIGWGGGANQQPTNDVMGKLVAIGYNLEFVIHAMKHPPLIARFHLPESMLGIFPWNEIQSGFTPELM